MGTVAERVQFLANKNPSGFPPGVSALVATSGITARFTGRLRSKNGRYSRSRHSTGVNAFVSSSRRITYRIFFLDQFFVKSLHAPGERAEIILGMHFLVAAPQHAPSGIGFCQRQRQWLVKRFRFIQIKEPAVLAVAHERASARGASG